MCGRYTNLAELSEMQAHYRAQLDLFADWQPSYNIAPSRAGGFEQPLIQRREGARVLRLGRWWFIPPQWRLSLSELPTTFNARAEDLDKQPFWRGAFASSRCLVPATGWREFRSEEGRKQPYHFHLAGGLFAFAGLCSRWSSRDGEVVDSFTIITTEPHPLVASIHDRMPLVLAPEFEAEWLDPEHERPTEILARARAACHGLPFEVYASDPVGNRPGVEGPEVLARVSSHRYEQQKLFE